MPFMCCVPNCKGNYANGPKVSTFSFPKDTDLRKKWIHAIKRDNFIPTNSSKVCESHFRPEDIERITSFYKEDTGELLTAPLKTPRLVKGVIPSKLPGCPKYLSNESSTRECPQSKKLRLDSNAMQKAITESLATASAYANEKSLQNIDDIYIKFNNSARLGEWNLVKLKNNLCFTYLEETPHPSVTCLVSITSDLHLTFYYHNILIKTLTNKSGCVKFPLEINNLNSLEEILQDILTFTKKKPEERSVTEGCNIVVDVLESLIEKLPEKKNSITFLQEQINLLAISKKNALRYSWETNLFCSLLHTISPHAYKFLRNSDTLILPCSNTIKKICSNFATDPRLEQTDCNFLQYVSTKFKLLQPNDKIVTLMIDEIHIKPCMDYKGGNVVGAAYDSANCATSAHVFMLNSLLSSYKEVVHIMPVKTLRAEILHEIVRKVILGLEAIGFEVLIVVSDNHAINRKAMSLFADPPILSNEYKHPNDPTRPLFYAVDSVHILKNLRNNWINQKPEQNMKYPDFKEDICRIASFESLKELHLKEKQQLLKYGYTLSLKSLYPTPIERQNVKLVLQIFNQHIVIALRELGPKVPLTNFEDTAMYIEIINRWWDIANVKTLLKGKRLKNPFQEPFTKNSPHIVEFLNNFLNWLNRWDQYGGGGTLTKETHLALKLTTEAYLKLADYCFTSKNFSFILPGQIQTDKLEERFGKYRYQAGAQYHISIRQLFESESKLRMLSIVPLILKSKVYGDIKISKEDISPFICQEENFNIENFRVPILLKNSSSVDDDDINQISDNIWPSLVYISGYASYSLLKKIKCQYCKVFLTATSTEDFVYNSSLITSNDRGGLCSPSESVVMCTAYTFVTFQNLLKEEHIFLKEKYQRKIVVVSALENIDGLDINLFAGHNCEQHSEHEIIKSVIFTISNILLKNYTKKQNDTTTTKTMPHLKRNKPSGTL